MLCEVTLTHKPSIALNILNLPSSWIVTIFIDFYSEEMRRRGDTEKAISLSVSALTDGTI